MSNNAVTSSAALIELKSDLTRLSKTLHVIYDLMNSDMSQVGQAWQDGKYQEFVEGYKPQINKCEEISERYTEWCVRVLDPTIENVLAVEKTDVSGGTGGGSVGGGGIVGGDSSTSMGGGTGASRKFNDFNFGGNKASVGEKTISGVGDNGSVASNAGRFNDFNY